MDLTPSRQDFAVLLGPIGGGRKSDARWTAPDQKTGPHRVTGSPPCTNQRPLFQPDNYLKPPSGQDVAAKAGLEPRFKELLK